MFLLVERNPGSIEDLTDLLTEDWSQLGSVRDMGAANKRFFRAEMEKCWGQKHLAVLDEEEAQKWLLGVTRSFLSRAASRSLRKAVRTQSTSCLASSIRSYS